ncbi:hypothetical protein K466DRAFT_662942 [Polyporus arcularius HHB13444]|uniref:F-box domain-containing protein n=1 Tax=Polyporus arcularius HHB13444 TaxID=1314778 RepID=A0A5C3PF95_9APHY|nr:hypothetical protein K466DRAFT_662942 [Polyporus arcularius HHB13444]
MDVVRELNYDILHLVMTLCQRQEISMMMKTSKLLYLQGAKLLLSEMVILRSEDDIVSFIAFMLGGPKNLDRFRHPLKVHITAEFLSPQGAAHLRDFLFDYGHMLLFRVLAIAHAEQILATGPYLPEAFAEIDFIGRLSLREAGLLVRAMFQEMRNEVLNVTVAFELPTPKWRGQYLDSYQNNPIVVLAPLCNTLYSVSGTWGATDPTKDVYEGIIFHGVVSLQLRTKVPMHVRHYAHAFPNVVDLDVSTSMDKKEEDLPDYQDWHDDNCAAQRFHGSWPRLDYFCGAVPDWWALSLECEVERMEIPDLLGWQFALFAEQLRTARPKYLAIDVGASTVVLEEFGTLFRQPEKASTLSRLAALRLDIRFDPIDRHRLEPSSMLDMLAVACVGAAQLQWLQVSLDCWRLRFDYHGLSRDTPTEDAPISPAEVFFQKLNLHALVRQLRREIPTLRAVSVRMRSLRGREPDTAHLGEPFPPDAEWDRLYQHLAEIPD